MKGGVAHRVLAKLNRTVAPVVQQGHMPVVIPGTINLKDVTSINSDIHKGVIINPEYRKHNRAANEEFFYFIRRIIPDMNPSVSSFRQEKEQKFISEMFSVADEAVVFGNAAQ